MKKHSVQDLLEIMAHLRSPEGCPWDREQDHRSILTCLLEEAYEFIDAVENNDVKNMQEELGDLLLQVVFHSQIATENSQFSFAEVVAGLAEKLIRRHPHVFGDAKLESAHQVQRTWDAVKEKEKKDEPPPDSALGQIPRSLPTLLRATKLQQRARKVGFDWKNEKGAWAKVEEEIQELREATRNDSQADIEEELGDLLFSVVNLSRHLGVEAEQALANANRKFSGRFREMETMASEKGKKLTLLTLTELEELWVQTKNGSGS